MRPEPTRTIHVAPTCGYFVKEPDETAWIITRHIARQAGQPQVRNHGLLPEAPN